MLGGRLLSDRQEIDGVPGALGRVRARRTCGSAERAADARARRCSVVMTMASMARSSAYPIIARCRRRISRGSGCGRSWRSARCSPPAPSSAAIVFGGNDRPGSDDGGRRADLRQSLCRRGGPSASSSSPTTMTAGAPRAIFGAPASKLRRVVDTRPAVAARCYGGLRRRASVTGASDHRRRRAVARVRAATDPDAQAAVRPSPAMHRGVRRLESQSWSCLPSWQPPDSGEKRLRHSYRAAAPKGMTVAGAANGAMTLAACIEEGTRAGRTAIESLGLKAASDTLPTAAR